MRTALNWSLCPYTVIGFLFVYANFKFNIQRNKDKMVLNEIYWKLYILTQKR